MGYKTHENHPVSQDVSPGLTMYDSRIGHVFRLMYRPPVLRFLQIQEYRLSMRDFYRLLPMFCAISILCITVSQNSMLQVVDSLMSVKIIGMTSVIVMSLPLVLRSRAVVVSTTIALCSGIRIKPRNTLPLNLRADLTPR